MTDYQQLTDDQLDAMLAAEEAKKAPKLPDAALSGFKTTATPVIKPAGDKYSGMTDAELDSEIASAQAKKLEPEVIQEMHPDFSDADRFVTKNFSTNNEAAVNYLQQRHPNLEIRVDDQSGQIQARARDGKDGGAYRVLDPDNGVLSTVGNALTLQPEALRDLGDVTYDIGSGAATGLASAAAGLGVGAATGGTGAIPAAMLAGAGASGGLEDLRQRLGRHLGLEQEQDWTQTGIATAGGALSPLLMGSGGTVTSALGKKIVGEGADAATTAAIQASQRGLIGRGVDAFGKPLAAKVGGVLSGTSSEALQTLGTRFKDFKKLSGDPEGVLNFLDETGNVVDTKFQGAKAGAWDEFTTAVGAAGDAETVDLAPVKERFKAAIKEAEKGTRKGKGTEASQELVSELKGAYERYFKYDAVEQVPNVVQKATGLLDEFGKPVMTDVTEMTEQQVRKELTALSPKAALDLDQQLSELANFQSLKPAAVTGSRFKPSQSAVEKKLMTLGAGLKKDLGQQIDAVVPENALPARRRYGELANLERNVNTLTQNPRQAFTNLRNADISSNVTNKQLFHKVDRVLGTDLLERAKMAEAVELFGPGRKSIFSGGLQGRIPAALAGGALGAYAGRTSGSGSGYEGGLAGAAAGTLLGSPAAMRGLYVPLGRNLGLLNQTLGVPRVGLGQAAAERAISPWMGVKP